MNNGPEHDRDWPSLDTSFLRACADANERSLQEMRRMELQRDDIRNNLGISKTTMAEWTAEHQALVASGALGAPTHRLGTPSSS
ncbi:hypothetical protein H310_03326 [Aphanomyces invadans]|uniref:Uncharacterized protein n=1 Tax=Aphanomyces invadans TaxID=157072 RepID=A0A024UI83_9STRA|nr:hypothetical protein H310_03326 [Aphanomyces invadans]ETW05582.1 hypothetical protein H310_03326 [Aphanomyces invadans]|eukprot:XP_008865359.1 hypothetical protein H310_03326 [Aphanomyces invadans]